MVPVVRAHGSVRAWLADFRGGLAGCHIAGEAAVADDVRGLRRNAFVVESKGPQTRPVLDSRVADDIHDLGGILQISPLIQSQKAHAREVGFCSQNAVELYRVADRFMDLERQL